VIIFIIAKFTEGAWIIVVVGPLMYYGLMRFHRQYVREEKAFEANSARAGMKIRMNRVIIFVDNYDLPTERALLYCASLNAYSIRAVHFDVDNLVTKRLESNWGRANTASANVSLEIVECEDRRVDRAALELVADAVRDPDVFCMVILPRRGFVSRCSDCCTTARPTRWRTPSCTCRERPPRSFPTARFVASPKVS
jgi:hypothetical protein